MSDFPLSLAQLLQAQAAQATWDDHNTFDGLHASILELPEQWGNLTSEPDPHSFYLSVAFRAPFPLSLAHFFTDLALLLICC